MSWSPAVPPPPLAAAYGGRIKKRAGLPKLLHKLFIKVLRLRPPAAEPTTMSAALGACYGYRMGSDEEYCYYYSYDGGLGSSWAGVLSSIPEEEVDSSEEGSPDVAAPAVLRKAKSDQFVVGSPEAAAAVVRVEVLL